MGLGEVSIGVMVYFYRVSASMSASESTLKLGTWNYHSDTDDAKMNIDV